MADPVHPAASKGYAAAAHTYVAGRPDYPLEVMAWLRADLALGEGKTVLDLGAGTGKFTPNLLATGAKVIAVEPSAAMLEQLAARCPGVEARQGTADRIPLPDASLDAVVCAQSFHWFAGAAALEEIRRVLRPWGVLGLIWNVRDETVDWVARLSRITDPHEGDAPRYRSGAWRGLFPAAGFGPLHERHFANAHVGDPERVIVDRTLSVSFIAALPRAGQDRVAAEVRRLVAAEPALAGRAEVAFPYTTMAFSCLRLGDPISSRAAAGLPSAPDP